MDKKRTSIDFSELNKWYNDSLRVLKEDAMLLTKKRKKADIARRRHRAIIRRERIQQRILLRRPHEMVRRSQVAELKNSDGLPEAVSSAVRFHMSTVHGVSKCESCGKIKKTNFFSLGSTKLSGFRSISKNCIRCTAMAGYDADPLVWFCKYIVNESRSRALANGNVFTVDWKWVHDRFNAIEGKCELCDRSMTTFKRDYRGDARNNKSFMSNPLNLSLDQRVPGGGYTSENLQLVNLQCNLAKLDTQQEEFVSMCMAVSRKFSD